MADCWSASDAVALGDGLKTNADLGQISQQGLKPDADAVGENQLTGNSPGRIETSKPACQRAANQLQSNLKDWIGG